MKISGLELLVLEVNSIEESLAFYNSVLDFEINKHTPDSEPPMATLQAGSLKLTLAQQLETMLKRGRGVNFFFGVDDVDEYYREIKERGGDVSAPVDEGWGGRFITLQDPDKYRLFFVEWSRGGSDFGVR
ncbi:MAG TPA: VOC family protein [Pyrinomonadaceae bacterium]|jgi:predicted enzyme related to lactoylglutathione lyase